MKQNSGVVLIAGGNGALGQAVVPAFGQAGMQVVTLDRRALTEKSDGRLSIRTDVTDEADIRRAVNQVMQTTGRIDALINLVGGFAPGRAVETETSLWQRMLTMNVTSAFLLSKAVLPHMVERKSGRIVHVAAQAAVEPFAGAAAYIVSKSALVALVRTLALETAGTGVTVNGILPTTIDTPANRKNMPDADTSKWVSPGSIAQLIRFVASSEAARVNGALIPIGAT